jgi:protein phosphatase 1 regulatory subunit 37
MCNFRSSKPLTRPRSLSVPIADTKELSNLYKVSCEKHNTTPLASIIENLEAINLDSPATTIRTEVLNLRHETLSHESCEALEELFKRVKYKAIDLTSCSLDDVSASAIFDMIEYYEAANELNISENSNIKNRGWLSCE